MRRSSGETLLLVVPLLRGGDGVDDMAVAYLLEEQEVKRRREEVHTGRSEVGTPLAAGGARVAPLCRAGAQAHRARPAGLSSVLFVKEEEEEEEGKKLPKLRASSLRGSCWSSSTTGTLLGVGSSHRRPCVSVWATSPRALRHVAECLPHVAIGFKDAATDSELTAHQVRPQYCAERRSTMASLSLVTGSKDTDVCFLHIQLVDKGLAFKDT